jgi:hypothetical protein
MPTDSRCLVQADSEGAHRARGDAHRRWRPSHCRIRLQRVHGIATATELHRKPQRVWMPTDSRCLVQADSGGARQARACHSELWQPARRHAHRRWRPSHRRLPLQRVHVIVTTIKLHQELRWVPIASDSDCVTQAATDTLRSGCVSFELCQPARCHAHLRRRASQRTAHLQSPVEQLHNDGRAHPCCEGQSAVSSTHRSVVCALKTKAG